MSLDIFQRGRGEGVLPDSEDGVEFFFKFGLHIFQRKFGRMTKIHKHQLQKVQIVFPIQTSF